MRRTLLLALLATALLGGCVSRVPVGLGRPAALYVDCRGERTAAPTVILESGAFGVSADWDQVLDDLAAGGRVCAYDRAGLGRSPPRGGGHDVKAVARELRGLLDQLGERRPVILVGHSNGALYVETFAALWPQRVAGLVYIQGVTSDDLDFPVLLAELRTERQLAQLAAFSGRIGLGPAVSHLLVSDADLSGDAAQRKQEGMDDALTLGVASQEDQAIIDGLSTVRALGGAPRSIPVAVVVGATDSDSAVSRAWFDAESASARRARAGWVLQAPGATHTSPLGRDRAYVKAAVDWLRSARSPRRGPG